MKDKNLKGIKWETTTGLEERGFLWYAVFFIVVVGFVIFAWFQKNFLFIFLIILGSVLILSHGRSNKKIKCELNDNEFLINGKENVYKYENLLGFSIVEEDDGNYFLVLHMKNKLMPYVKVRFPQNKKEDIENFLKGKLRQEKYEESLVDVLFEKLKF